jgi:hypothetical protein
VTLPVVARYFGTDFRLLSKTKSPTGKTLTGGVVKLAPYNMLARGPIAEDSL